MKQRILIGLMTLVLFASVATSADASRRRLNEPPIPRLIVPSDDADLRGKEFLEFRWSSEGDRSVINGYDIRIYKGPQTYENALMLKKELPAAETSLKVESSLFENGATYAWTARSTGKKKSKTDHSVFKVIK